MWDGALHAERNTVDPGSSPNFSNFASKALGVCFSGYFSICGHVENPRSLRKGASNLFGVYQRRGATANKNRAKRPRRIGVLAREKF
jgi:hypothetical protein